ncbi:MAG TPA: endonuclease VIII [Candidatus Poseidoniales archaeon]|nr:MAG TPA: endonuclease VIII [Candidatus Poseidoniales archaeon]
MPEGPETHRVAHKLAKAFEGKKLEQVSLFFPSLAGQEALFLNQEVEYIRAKSKALLISVGDTILYSHNQLYGRWTVNLKTTKLKPTGRTLRLELGTDKHVARLWSATDIMLLEPWMLSGHPYLSKLGPDVADIHTEVSVIFGQLKERKFQRRQLCHLLLDQSFLAGVGNYLRSEILYHARLSPFMKLLELSDIQKSRLAYSAKKIPHRAFIQKGVTVPSELFESLKSNGLTRRQARHFVFTRDGEPCWECGVEISHKRVSGRRLDFCIRCQKVA